MYNIYSFTKLLNIFNIVTRYNKCSLILFLHDFLFFLPPDISRRRLRRVNDVLATSPSCCNLVAPVIALNVYVPPIVNKEYPTLVNRQHIVIPLIIMSSKPISSLIRTMNNG